MDTSQRSDEDFQPLLPKPYDGSNNIIEPFSYPPLKSDQHIRLLKIKGFDIEEIRDSFSEDIDGQRSTTFQPYYELIQADMDNLPNYHAISYAWGEPERTHFIMLSGMYNFPITTSLAIALSRLVRMGFRSALWIDQICIDQSKSQEKSKQVKMMGEIYSNAKEVFIWTGEELEGLDEMRDNIARSDTLSVNNVEVFYQLLCRSWFQRAWVVQEAVLAKTVTVLAGSCQVPFLELSHAWEKCYRHFTPDQFERTYDSSVFIKILIALRGDLEAPLDWVSGFHSLLNSLGNCQASDPRDHVYAFLGFQQHFGISIIPDYSLSTPQVFTSAARAIIEATTSLDILRLLPTQSTTAINRNQLPSWVPNWSNREWAGRIQPDFSGDRQHIQFNACNGRRHIYQASQAGPQQLLVSGQIIDCTELILPMFQPAGLVYPSTIIRERPRFFSLSDENVIAIDKEAHNDQTDTLRKRLVAVFTAGQVNIDNETSRSSMSNSLRTVEELLSLYDDNTVPIFNLDELFNRVVRLSNHTPFHSQNRKLGLAPHGILKGDVVAILHGLEVPVILRQLTNGAYELLGQCFLEDAMFGEAVIWKEHEACTLTLV